VWFLAPLALAQPWTQVADRPGVLSVADVDRAWGTASLAAVLAEVGARLAERHPDADPLEVGDLSVADGGPLEGHATHDRGVDADIGLFRRGGRQPWNGFVDLRPSDLDLPLVWDTIVLLLDSGPVEYVLLDQEHIDALRRWLVVERRMAPDLVDRVFPSQAAPWTLRGVVRHAHNHKSHLHVHVAGEPAT
jgi:hypothetical protein